MTLELFFEILAIVSGMITAGFIIIIFILVVLVVILFFVLYSLINIFNRIKKNERKE